MAECAPVTKIHDERLCLRTHAAGESWKPQLKVWAGAKKCSGRNTSTLRSAILATPAAWRISSARACTMPGLNSKLIYSASLRCKVCARRWQWRRRRRVINSSRRQTTHSLVGVAHVGPENLVPPLALEAGLDVARREVEQRLARHHPEQQIVIASRQAARAARIAHRTCNNHTHTNLSLQ